MNPKITITVDPQNKAISAMSGMVTVGAKIDVEIRGIERTSVPSWEEEDPFVGKSLRLRIVDFDGRDLVRFPIVEKSEEGDGDKWTDTTEVGEDVFRTQTGLEGSPFVNFDTNRLRWYFKDVPFNAYQELGVILDSIVDNAQYAVGKIKVRQWTRASCEDPTILPDLRHILNRFAFKPTTGTLGEDSSLDDVIAKVNLVIKQTRGERS